MSRKKKSVPKQKIEPRPDAPARVAQSSGAVEQDPVAASDAGSQGLEAIPDSGFPIVGIGASAGGLAAFEGFFSGMPDDLDPGMAFVLVQHLAPDHKSILTDLVKRYTRMKVFEVEDGMLVRCNCAYIIPPNHDMALFQGTLQLLNPTVPRGHRLPIDFFFRSLAEDQGARAIGIVLSGTGSDGTLGLRAIKGEGGMAMVQTPASTEFDGMPRSAIATGLVDFELPPAEMPAQLIAYAAQAFGKLTGTTPASTPIVENGIKKIFILLRAQTSHDFSQYKPSTIRRRIERRMAVHQIQTVDEYVKYAQKTPAEVQALFRELLIGVTSFFRDPEAFKAIEKQVIPGIFGRKPAGGVIRVWLPGCATGEEAYSLAILLAERQAVLKEAYKVQVFATDIDSQAIAKARAGLYPENIVADVSPERLSRFFVAEPDGHAYRIRKSIRDMLVFSEQDVTRDSPFSRLDLISCRNLLIYMSGDLQKKLFPLFHYALNPDGVLFLGTSETVGDFGHLFTALDRKWKFYQRNDAHPGASHMAHVGLLSSGTVQHTALPQIAGKAADSGKLSLRGLTEQTLLQQVVPSAALVNGHGEILYLHGRTGLYLEPTPGVAGVNNILKMAREGLGRGLTTALHDVVARQEIVRCPGLRVKTTGHPVMVNLTIWPVSTGLSAVAQVHPATTSDAQLYLVILEQAASFDKDPSKIAAVSPAGADADGFDMLPGAGAGEDADARITALRQELQAKEEYLQTSNEELKSSNEEMQSVNEELQSTNEELETSKEELQSVNEELATINAELKTKVTDLSQANNDMNNLLAGTGIGTVFVDHGLRILRFSPAVTNIINLIQSDTGRPVSHIVSNLVGYDDLVADTQAVLDTLTPKEVEVQTRSGTWFTMRILPYRTIDNVIEGAVINFVDITVRKHTEAALRETHIRLAEAIAATVREPLLVLDGGLRVVSASTAFFRTFQVTPDVSLGRLLSDLGNGQWAIPALCQLLEEILSHNTVITDFEVTHEFEQIGRCTMRLNARGIFSEADQSVLILLAIEDIMDCRPQDPADPRAEEASPNHSGGAP
jgi:two-component system CheB/CheR fusion protein